MSGNTGSGSGGQPPQDGPAQGGPGPQQGGQQPQQGGPPQQGGNWGPQGGPPQQGGYPPQQGGPQQGGYPPQQQGGYPQQGNPQQGGYPPQQQGGYPPQQPPPGGPGGPGGWGPQGPQDEPRRNRGLWIGGTAALAVAALVAGYFVLSGGEDAGVTAAGEIFLEPAAAVGPDPFSEDPLAGGAEENFQATDPPTEGDGGTTTATSGGEPGLYGGTTDKTKCDIEQLKAFLTDPANSNKAQAWVTALNADPKLNWPGGQLAVADIPAYLDSLSSLVLTSDLRVTNHGYKGDGQPTVIRQSVLQSGSAVLIDPYGVARVKCFCGNPLIGPLPQPEGTKYVNEPWPGFDPGKVIVVTPPPEPLDHIEVKDPNDPGELITVMVGGPPPIEPSPEASPPVDEPAPEDDPSNLQTIGPDDTIPFQVQVPPGLQRETKIGEDSKLPQLKLGRELDDVSFNNDEVRVVDITGSPKDPENYIDLLYANDNYDFDANCTTNTREPFSYGRWSGEVYRIGGCPGMEGTVLSTYDLTAPNGDHIGVIEENATGRSFGILSNVLDTFRRP